MESNAENIYSPPVSASDSIQGVRVVGSTRAIIFAWEKLRIWYNLLLFIPGVIVLLLFTNLGEGLEASFGALFIAVGANVCFLLGPLSEVYASAIINKPELPTLRKSLFILGIIISFTLFGFLALLPNL